jgi:hypothetical protein
MIVLLNNVVADILDIQKEDEIWFEENNITISLIQISDNQISLSGDIGLYENDEPVLVTIISEVDEYCKNSFIRLRKKCEERINNTSPLF